MASFSEKLGIRDKVLELVHMAKYTFSVFFAWSANARKPNVKLRQQGLHCSQYNIVNIKEQGNHDKVETNDVQSSGKKLEVFEVLLLMKTCPISANEVTELMYISHTGEEAVNPD